MKQAIFIKHCVSEKSHTSNGALRIRAPNSTSLRMPHLVKLLSSKKGTESNSNYHVYDGYMKFTVQDKNRLPLNKEKQKDYNTLCLIRNKSFETVST